MEINSNSNNKNEIKSDEDCNEFGISILVAASTNNVIGKNNQLIWNLPNDMKFFKATTWAMPIIMGRKTFESIGNKALKGRKNIVISSQNFVANEIIFVTNISDAIQNAKQTNCKEIFIVGGSTIYEQTIQFANTIYLTRVHTAIDGDAYFPTIDTQIWKLESKTDFNKDEKHAFDYSFEKWIRK